MTDSGDAPVTRVEFHRQHQADAVAEAERLLARRGELQGAWLHWVAGELYRLGPPLMPPWCGGSCSASAKGEAAALQLPRSRPLLTSSGTGSFDMRLRNNAARASSSVVTGTVIDSRMGISQACSTGASLSHEK